MSILRADFVEFAYEYPFRSLPLLESENYFSLPLRVAREMGFAATVYSMLTYLSPKREEIVDGVRVRRSRNPLALYLAASKSAPRLAHGHSFGWIPASLGPTLIDNYVFTPHVYRLDAYNRLATKVLARLVGVSKAIITLTNHEARQFRPYGGSRVHIIPHPVDLRFFQTPDPEGVREIREKFDASRIILCVANLMPKKNLETLLRALKIVKTSVPKSKVVIAGGRPRLLQNIGRPRPYTYPYPEQLAELVLSLGLEEDVVFAGHLTPTKLRAFYQASDVYSLPTLGECQSISTGEAAACGLPMVLSNIEPFLEQFGDCALFHPPQNAEALAQRLSEILTNEVHAKQLGAKAKERVRSYEIRYIKPKLRALYEECLT